MTVEFVLSLNCQLEIYAQAGPCMAYGGVVVYRRLSQW